MIVASYLFHLRARNLSAHTIKATKDYLTPFVACNDPLTATKRDIEQYLIEISARCKPSTVLTACNIPLGGHSEHLQERSLHGN